ncbi:ImmA/IrrE family metallo-endopeptidase [Syntrophomonas palmitatica]|uniref:ImmA/IrrE family metallo-endopeptidase n=1 Tax=Syntrophomonas palmitatica TaxID=402877 RepID=UPI00241D75B9|nr:ImmA/IrrE family metallo-endopeptidase [Syntrophomonas palmitatica]
MYFHEEGKPPTIALSERLSEGSSLYRCVLAEELGHHFTSAGNLLPSRYFYRLWRSNISRGEYKARKWAAETLIPRQKLKAALAAGARETWELAEEFGVTCEIVQLRLSLNDCQELIRSYRGQED